MNQNPIILERKMHIMKKIGIILVAFVLATSLSLPVFAEQNEELALKDKKIEMKSVNLTDQQKKEVQDIMSKINDLKKRLRYWIFHNATITYRFGIKNEPNNQ
jgi:hypothetical protein